MGIDVKALEDYVKERQAARAVLVNALKEAAHLGSEEGHMAADKALIAYIDDTVVASLYAKLHKWYS